MNNNSNNLYTVKINGKEQDLRFTLQAIDYLDKVYTTDINGFSFGAGILTVSTYLETNNPVAIFHTLKAGLLHLKDRKPSDEVIEEQIEKWAINNQLDMYFKKLGKCLKNSPLTKGTLAKINNENEQKSK